MGHRPSTRRTVGELLYDDFEPYQKVSGTLVSVFVSEDSSELTMNLTFGTILFRTDPNDDTLYWRDSPRKEDGIDISQRYPWLPHLGHSFDHAWLMMNRKGYIDGALLSFGDLRPAIALNVVASSIKVSEVGPWREASSA